MDHPDDRSQPVHRTTHRTLLGALAVTVALLVSACGTSGGNDDAGKDDKATTTTEAKETTTTVSPEDEAQARAESVDLTESDFPDGFTASPATADDDDQSGLEQCTDESNDKDVLGQFTTDDFTYGDLGADDGVQVSVKTKVFTDEAAAKAALEPFSDEDVISCVNDLFTQQFESQGSTVDGSIDIADYGDTKADEAALVGGQLTVTTADGTEVPLTVAVVVLRTGDVASQLSAIGVGSSTDEVDISDVATKIEELQADA